MPVVPEDLKKDSEYLKEEVSAARSHRPVRRLQLASMIQSGKW